MPWKDQVRKKEYGRKWYLEHKQQKAAKDKLRQSTKEFKAAQRVRSREYYHANREHVLQQKKQYHAANRQKVLAKMRTYEPTPEQKERQRRRIKERRHWLKPETVKQRAEHYKNHRDEVRAREKRFREQHPELYRARRSANWHKRRATLKNLSEHFTHDEWLALVAKYDHTCIRCKRRAPEIALTSDHVVPLSRGGNNTIANIQPLCGECNCWKGTKVIDFRESYSSVLTIPRLASAYHPGPAEEFRIIFPLTADSASLKHSPASTTNDASSSR